MNTIIVRNMAGNVAIELWQGMNLVKVLAFRAKSQWTQAKNEGQLIANIIGATFKLKID